ncbi:hypothetical protein G6F57_005163 [Rhizopus arrhizus]|jgi:hypothetical protein|uniref:Uncharacterized protein n=3 Tax=Rhizopus TaxID=4842 RepID=I1CDY1_RHIO9|nr:hypothetical protein RO3G_11372 [Rhizopus delemar RA 99-880]KAG0744272.1 hypothetical protein G6F23_005359 [Rhizopus arrhizus]KAG1058092.1 hypothetical protein G6F43_000127 [Rhizopus delemar]KAG0766791.1 hypothetical protein G6F24_003319 [Rhizopus arrhizus]KAG0781261.1 hypothetical protein G6F22_009661 [Rhizopus arrhizus]|eukprot:EIE86661.1 hypothetical protein RO3G_11372 [Rhizopus delemar RA 99-880]
MDSNFDYIHWNNSSLAAISDSWADNSKSGDPIDVPTEIDVEETIDLQLNEKENNKKKRVNTIWRPHPMDH